MATLKEYKIQLSQLKCVSWRKKNKWKDKEQLILGTMEEILRNTSIIADVSYFSKASNFKLLCFKLWEY